MKRRLKAGLMAFIMVFSMIVSTLTGAVVAKADDNLYIKLHYNRPDGVYEDWNVWFWAAGADGQAIEFKEENGEMVATYTVPAGVMEVGYIVRLGEWVQKDVDMDQFIDVLDRNKSYVPMLVLLNKVDLVDDAYVEELKKYIPEFIPISADKKTNIDELKDIIFDNLDLVRVYLKPQGTQPPNPL